MRRACGGRCGCCRRSCARRWRCAAPPGSPTSAPRSSLTPGTLPDSERHRLSGKLPAARRRQPPRSAGDDGVHARLPHRPLLHRRGVAGDDADRRVPRPQEGRRRRPGARPAVVEGRRRPVRRRRRHRHRALVRDGPAVAEVHGAVGRRLRHRLRDRGDLLLHRGDLHRHLHLRLEADRGLEALLDRRPDRDRRHRRRLQRRRRQLVDEPARRLHDGRRRHDHQRRPARRALQPGDDLRVPAHVAGRLHGRAASGSPRSTRSAGSRASATGGPGSAS